MMGAGKTFFAEKLAKELKLQWVDTDQIVEKYQNMSITEIFNIYGEEKFRFFEQEVINEVALNERTIISTGGGVILNDDNIKALKKNGIIFFIDRDIKEIIKYTDTKNRPLLDDGQERLYKIYNERIDLYRGCADYTIKNNKNYKLVLNEIILAYLNFK